VVWRALQVCSVAIGLACMLSCRDQKAATAPATFPAELVGHWSGAWTNSTQGGSGAADMTVQSDGTCTCAVSGTQGSVLCAPGPTPETVPFSLTFNGGFDSEHKFQGAVGGSTSDGRYYLEPFLGSKPLEGLTKEHLRAFRIWLEDKQPRKLRPASVASVLTDARCLLIWAEDAGLIARAPIPRKLLPKLQEMPPDRLTDEATGKLSVLPDPYGFTVRLALGTGLRWSELCRAQASDLENGMLVVHRTKSGRVRRVPITGDLATEVRSRVGRLVPFATVSPGSFAKTARKLSGIKRFHVHQLRHTFACRWLERGGSLAALQEILGHVSITTTQRYGRLSSDMVQREAERIAVG